MRYIALPFVLLFFSFAQAQDTQQQDSCCISGAMNSSIDSLKKGEVNNDGFYTDVRVDAAGVSFLQTLGLEKFRVTNDYTGSLRNPGVLFNELDFSSFDLLNTSLTFSDKNNAQKVIFSPFRLAETNSNLLSNTRFNLALSNEIVTIGVAIGGDDSDPRLPKFDGLRDAVFSKGTYCIPECYQEKSRQEEARQKNQKTARDLLYLYDSLRTRRVFKWSLGYNTQLFSTLSSRGDNPVTDSLNYETVKSHSLSALGSLGLLNGKWVFSAGYNLIFARKSAEKGQKRIPYHGIQASASYRLIQFLKGERLKANENFIKTLYVPSLNIGIGYEYKNTNGEIQYVEKGIERSRVITPFLDILVTPQSQFRIGIPISNSRTVIDQKTLEVGALLQYSFKITSL